MNGYLSRRSEAQMLEETRSRAAEFYFNGTCLVRAVFNPEIPEDPIFPSSLACPRRVMRNEHEYSTVFRFLLPLSCCGSR
jgi:hypothetical protein